MEIKIRNDIWVGDKLPNLERRLGWSSHEDNESWRQTSRLANKISETNIKIGQDIWVRTQPEQSGSRNKWPKVPFAPNKVPVRVAIRVAISAWKLSYDVIRIKQIVNPIVYCCVDIANVFCAHKINWTSFKVWIATRIKKRLDRNLTWMFGVERISWSWGLSRTKTGFDS